MRIVISGKNGPEAITFGLNLKEWSMPPKPESETYQNIKEDMRVMIDCLQWICDNA